MTKLDDAVDTLEAAERVANEALAAIRAALTNRDAGLVRMWTRDFAESLPAIADAWAEVNTAVRVDLDHLDADLEGSREYPNH